MKFRFQEPLRFGSCGGALPMAFFDIADRLDKKRLYRFCRAIKGGGDVDVQQHR